MQPIRIMKKKYKYQILLAGVSSAFLSGVALILSAYFFPESIWLYAGIASVVFGVVDITWVKAIAKKSQGDPLE